MINKTILVGNVGINPEIKTTARGTELANFTLATSESWKDKQGEKQTKTQWHRVVVYQEGIVNFVKQYVKKGDKLYIEGSIEYGKYEDKNGDTKYTTSIVLQGFKCKIEKLNSKDDVQAEGDF